MTNTNTIISYPFLFSLLLPTLINLFKKNIHSLLTFTTTATCHSPTISSFGLGLGLTSATRDVDRPPNVVESATLRPNNKKRSLIGSIDDVIVAGADALVSCTETLGFESSDEIHNKKNNNDHTVDDEKGKNDDDDEIWRRRMMRAEGRGNWKKVRSFPPLLSSLNRNGKPSFYLRPVRKDGRLELTEVRIERSEILHASRQNGRLTLHLIPDQEEEEEEEEEEELEEEELKEELEEEEEEEEEEREWRLVAAGAAGGSEGLRRCHEMVNQHQQHHNHHHHVHGSLRMCGISIV